MRQADVPSLERARLALDPPRVVEPPAGSARWRVQAEDFEVVEELGFTPSGAGEHVLLTVRKRGANTAWVARELARLGGVRVHDVGYAGLKDRHALTTQAFTVPARRRPASEWLSVRGEGFEVLEACAHARKLPRGALRGNRFRLVLRDFVGDRSALEARVARLAREGAPNYFGPQRFGRSLANLDASAPPRFAYSAARSLIFNAVLATRIARGDWLRLHVGERANLDGSNASFRIEALDDTLATRLAALDIHPTGPMWGEGDSGIEGEIATLEAAVASAHPELCARLREEGLAPLRRPLRVAVRELTLRWLDSQDATSGASCELSFSLRAGSFASAVVRELVATADASAEDDDA
ncbi:MAG: tRNA pseudouridine(13) synthase TruD [Steroidobacteraceae bacterium]